MAGIGAILQGLAPLQSGYYQGVDERMRRQMLENQMRAQQQQDAGLAALANAYGSIQQTPPPSAPLPPPPGQASMPAQQGMQPPPQMPPGAMPRGQMGPPPQQQGPVMPPPVKPYTAPQPPQQVTPQQQMPQAQGIPAPPQVQAAVNSALPDLETMATTLKKQGITGMALFAALQQHQQFLNTDGKRELAQLAQEVKRMQAEAAMTRAGADVTRANTGAAGEIRRQESAEGGNAMSAAKIEQLKAQAYAAVTRANKAANSGQPADPADVSLLARGVAAGKIDPKSLSTKGGHRERVMEEALRINPDYDQKDYNAENAFGTSGMRAAGTAAANTAIAAGAAQGGADILMDAASKVPRTAITSMNKMWNASRGEFQDAKYGAFAAALNTFVNEYARAVNPKGTATVSDKEHAREILSAADSQETLEAKMDILRQEMKRGRQAPLDVANDLRAARRGGSTPKPTASDIAYAKAHPEVRAQFKAHFGIDP